jgi:hypothetical protein
VVVPIASRRRPGVEKRLPGFLASGSFFSIFSRAGRWISSMPKSQYETQKARKGRHSPEKVVLRKAKEKSRSQLSRVTRPLKRNKPLSDATCLAVVGLPSALFVAWIESQWQEGWDWKNYGCTSQGMIWNLDHIRALAHWNLLDPIEAKKANHWTNLAPACAKTNDQKREQYSDLDRWTLGTNLYTAMLETV